MNDTPNRLVYLLTEPTKLTVAVAESITSGLLQARFGKHPGISEVFKGGITAYSIDQKVRHLGIDGMHASEKLCVSDRVAREMAMGACCLFGTDLGLSTTGFAELKNGWLPHAFWAICRNTGESLEIVNEGKIEGETGIGRVEMQSRVADMVFEALVKYLEKERSRPHS